MSGRWENPSRSSLFVSKWGTSDVIRVRTTWSPVKMRAVFCSWGHVVYVIRVWKEILEVSSREMEGQSWTKPHFCLCRFLENPPTLIVICFLCAHCAIETRPIPLDRPWPLSFDTHLYHRNRTRGCGDIANGVLRVNRSRLTPILISKSDTWPPHTHNSAARRSKITRNTLKCCYPQWL